MKNILFLIFLSLMTATGLHAQKTDYDVLKDPENGSTVYKGEFTFAELLNPELFPWMQRGVDAYRPDSSAVKYLKTHLGDYEMVVLLGTWCEDSQNLIPRLYKTLQAADYPLTHVKMYGVDRSKAAKYVEARLYKADKVPTIILYKGHAEIGRITESVKKSIETDLAQIIRADLENATH